MSFKLNQNEFSIEFSKGIAGPTTTDSRSIVTSFTRHGGTVVFCTVVVGDWAGFGNCLPLSVNYSERSYSVNKMPPGFAKREQKNRENEILISRLIDRALRPTIDESFRFRVQISLTVLSYNAACPVEPICLTAASATLAAAGVPCTSIVGVKVGYSQGKWDFGSGEHTVVIAGNGYGLSTLESSGIQLHPDKMLNCIHFALPSLIGLSEYVRYSLNKVKKPTYSPVALESQSVNLDGRAIVEAYYKNDLHSLEKLSAEFTGKWKNPGLADFKWKKLVGSVLRSNMLWTLKRVDSRSMDELRHLTVQHNFLPNQGSILLSRGRTKVLTVPTVSFANDSQTFEALDGNEARKFVLHYNYLLGEDRVSRRDVGHGNLARNALRFGVSNERFIRIVSEILDSDGSSSMSSVAAACLSLKAIGAMSETVGGVSVGLIMEGYVNKFMVDITALEDNIGDMDLKIAGTKDGITALQMDIKIPVLSWSTFENAIHYGFGHLTKMVHNLKENEHQGRNDHVEPSNARAKVENIGPSEAKVVRHEHAPRARHEYAGPTEAKVNVENIGSREAKVDVEQLIKSSFEDSDTKNIKHNPQKQVPNKDKSKDKDKISINFTKDEMGKINAGNLVESIKKDFSAEIFAKNNALIFTGKNMGVGVNKFLTLLFNTGKEMYYGILDSVSDLDAEVTLVNGKKCTIKLSEPNSDIKKGMAVSVYKGKFGRWTLYSIIN